MSGKEAVTDDVPVRMMQNVPVMVEFSGRFKFSSWPGMWTRIL